MVHRSPVMGWHPGPTGENESALDSQTLSPATSSAVWRPVLPIYSPICLSPFHCGQQLLRPFQRVGAVSYHLHPQPAGGSGISRTQTEQTPLLFRSVTCALSLASVLACLFFFPQLQMVDNSAAVYTDGLRYGEWRLNVDFLPRANGPMKRAHAQRSPRQVSRQSSDNVLSVPPPIPPP